MLSPAPEASEATSAAAPAPTPSAKAPFAADPAFTPQVAGASTGRVPSLDSMELVPASKPMGPFARKTPDPVDPILNMVRSHDAAVRRTGLDALQEQRSSMSREQAHRLLWAAGGDLPEVDDEEIPVAEAILVAAQPWVSEGDVELLRSLHPRLPAGARSVALTLLAAIGTREAAIAWAEALERHGPGSHFGTRQSRPWADALAHGDVFFPALLDAGLPTSALEEILLLAGRFLEGDAFPPEALDSLQHAVVELWDETAEEVEEVLGGPAWGWSDRAKSLRRRASLLLDLMRFLSDGETAPALARGLASQDPRLRLFAIRASLLRGVTLGEDDVAPAAESPETRAMLYGFLKQARKASLMPRTWRSQRAMAEADLAGWLSSSTELGHPPDAIESAHVVTIEDADAGPVDWHLLRFRSGAPDWKARGWMVGVSGPWVRKDGPGGRAGGDTFSTYAPWQDRSPEEHAAALREVTDEWSGGD